MSTLPEKEVRIESAGYDALWTWFGLSRASWLTLPRSLLHEMPNDWQQRMADLLTEWDAVWRNVEELPTPHVAAKRAGRFVKWPEYLTRYRHPDKKQIDALRGTK